jgi:hypothetical protein
MIEMAVTAPKIWKKKTFRGGSRILEIGISLGTIYGASARYYDIIM